MAGGVTEELSAAVRCPVCAEVFKPQTINAHLDKCLDRRPSRAGQREPPLKKSRVCGEAAPGTPPPPAVFSMFQSRSATATRSDRRPPPTPGKRNPGDADGGEAERSLENATASGGGLPDAKLSGQPTGQDGLPVAKLSGQPTGQDGLPVAKLSGQPTGQSGPTTKTSNGSVSRTLLNLGKPLADKLRPNTLEEYFGQNKVVGEHTLMRSLLDAQEVPSLILWGPPGCGKTTLAHIIASASKKKGTARFITLSATSATTSEVREIIKQAQNELRLCKRKTILFIDEIHRFNKSQQDTFLPHVECGTLTLIGATTENPSFQVNAALLSRCRVLVLEKLSVEAMSSILHRAIASLGIRVLGQDVTDPEDKDQSDAHEPKVYIEQKALDTIAHLCDGDARAGLTGLQLAVQAQVGLACPNQSAQDGPPQAVVVQEEHVKEGLQRSHILYDKAGEEHFNCISALHKSMRGSNENASLYWLGRMLEGGEDPLYVARRLVRFASEDVGLADPSALPQAVSAFQACHFIGMPECEVILAQCVVYLARAPKSVEIYKAYSNVKACLRNHKGPLPSVPLHLRNAPTKLMKDLGYAKGYKYNPNFSSTAEQEYLPEELQAVDFFTWTPSNP
ncbi:ATPase WRNIP1 isoform X2 [Lampris incognitus]|uniref:ATPase WRNIP1 isoform X2 n=1 Tax=Lampris incognitus TaxID=2546036 RepID=UPI0024B56963|nr:ATPase WRNIP1 isoform X2 [Lampris incognitus]